MYVSDGPESSLSSSTMGSTEVLPVEVVELIGKGYSRELATQIYQRRASAMKSSALPPVIYVPNRGNTSRSNSPERVNIAQYKYKCI